MKRNLIEIVPVVCSLLFAVAISLYHVSYDGYLGLSEHAWGTVWAVSENGLSLLICILVVINTSGMIRQLFEKTFIPYFGLKLVYHISCYSGVYLFSVKTWELIWSVVLCVLLLISFIYLLILIHSRRA